jgi:7-carboxy-7-deazaguanine synthase
LFWRELLKTNQSLFIEEMFESIQGEGFNSGTPALFIRLRGCNAVAEGLECASWCDTKYSWQNKTDAVKVLTVSEAAGIIEGSDRPLIVITGGEPLLQAKALQNVFDELGYDPLNPKVAIETNGTLPRTLTYGNLFWTVSPKPPAYLTGGGPIDELKVIVPHEVKQDEQLLDEFIAALEVLEKDVPSSTHLFLQPEDSNLDLAKFVAELLLDAFPNWRLGLQVHRLLEVR